MHRVFPKIVMTLALALACVSLFAQTNAVACVEVAWPASLAPAYREFEAKCAAGTATRGDLIALKRFIAARAVDGASKTNLTREVRRVYQRGKKAKKESRSRK